MDIVEINYMTALCIGLSIFFIWMYFYPENLNFLLNRISGNSDYIANEFEKTKEDAILALFLPYAQKLSAKNYNKVNKTVLIELDKELEAAGRPLNMEAIDYYNMKFVTTGVLTIVGLIIGLSSDFGVAVAIFAGFGGFVLPKKTITRIAEGRAKRAEMELPDVLNLLSVCMASGMTLTKAMDIICKRNEGLIIDELKKIQGDIERGSSMVQAFEKMTERIKSKTIRDFYLQVKLSEELGTPIADALIYLASSIRENTFELVKQKAAKAASLVLIPVLIFILPAMLLIVVGPMIPSFLEG